MIPAYLYYPFYLFLISAITIVVYNKYNIKPGYPHNIDNEPVCVVLVIFMTFYIGLRPLSRIFTDMGHYAVIYETFYDGGNFVFSLSRENFLFDNLFMWWGSKQYGYTSFFLFISAIYFICSYLGIRRLFPNNTLAAYLVFLAAFSTFSYGTNGIKAGAAASLYIWAIGYRSNLKLCIPLMIISWGFHHSMILPIAAFVLTCLFKKPKWYYWGWLFCFLMALLHVSFFSRFFAGISDERGAEYLLGSGNAADGEFRLDFILYSIVPIVFGFILEIKRKTKVTSLYQNLIHLYICINGVWMLCMYASFSNRIAYLSWFLYPIVLIYPFLYENWGKNRYLIFRNVMACQLLFTLFMTFIYY